MRELSRTALPAAALLALCTALLLAGVVLMIAKPATSSSPGHAANDTELSRAAGFAKPTATRTPRPARHGPAVPFFSFGSRS